jgi:hypothetical protein
MLARALRDAAFLEIMKIFFLLIHCFHKMHTIAYFKSLLTSW